MGRTNAPGEAAFGVAMAGGYAYLADGGPGLQVIAVTNPAAPVRVGGWTNAPGGAAFGVTVADGYAYVVDRTLGLKVIAVTNPAAPIRVGGCTASGDAWAVAVSEVTPTWRTGMVVCKRLR